MIKSKFTGYTIEMKLPQKCGYKGYSVECRYRYLKSQGKYLLSMWLKRDDISDKFKIESQEINTLPISGTKDTIVGNICRVVEQASLSGYFNPYIERFEYTYRCFELGNTLFEKEMLNNKDIYDTESDESAHG